MGEHSFTYEALRGREIRVLRLLPGHGAMPLLASVEKRELAQDGVATADFDALSYVWGTGSKSSSIHINGAALAITESLSSFLRRLRSAAESCVLWADAICINQDDIEEKGCQISLMADIYSTANRVLIDLGEDSADSALALDLLGRFWRKHIWSGAISDLDGGILSPQTAATYIGVDLPDQTVTDEELPPDDSPKWSSVAEFFSRPWFTRIWVVQEFVLAKEPTLFCGTVQVKWQDLFASTWTYCSWQLPPSTMAAESIRGRLAFMCMGAVRQIRSFQANEEGRHFLAHTLPTGHLWEKFQRCRLIDVLHHFSIADATVAKDRYYAILSIAADVSAGDGKLGLSYEMPLDEVVTHVGRFLVQNEYGQEMLARAGLWQQKDQRVPSWVQDFGRSQSPLEMMDRTVVFMGDEATGNLTFYARVIPLETSPRFTGFLMVQGALLDTIEEEPFRSDLDEKSLTSPDLGLAAVEYISKALRVLLCGHDNVKYFNGEHLLDVACEAIISGLRITMRTHEVIAKGFFLAAWMASEREGVPRIKRLEWVFMQMDKRYGVGRDELSQLVGEYISNVAYSAISQRKKPARTARGYFGGLPSCFRAGDQIWVVKGCRPPLLLRKSDEYPACYQLVGSCYVHGFMNGEALKKEGFRFEQVSLH